MCQRTTHSHVGISGGFVIIYDFCPKLLEVDLCKGKRHVALLWEFGFQDLIPDCNALLLSQSIFPNSKEENKVNKSKNGSNSKDNEEGIFVVHRPGIKGETLTLMRKTHFIVELHSTDLCSFRRCCCLTCKTKELNQSCFTRPFVEHRKLNDKLHKTIESCLF